MDRISKAIRDEGLLDALIPEQDRIAIQSASMALDEFGVIQPPSIKAYRQPITYDWIVSDTARKRVPRAGTISLIASHAVTAPNSGPLTIRISQEYPGSGESIIWTTYHPSGQKMFTEEVSIPVLAGTWLSTSLIAAGGSTNQSVSVVINVG